MSVWTDSSPSAKPATQQKMGTPAVATPAARPEPSHIADADADDALRRHGITAVQSRSFEYAGYRYTNINDAIAAAKRNPGATT